MSHPKQHVHSALILEKARQDATGETAAGWWRWEISHGADFRNLILLTSFLDGSTYRYSMTDKHPQYVPAKPVLRLIDMAKLPHRARVKCGQSTYDIDRTREGLHANYLCTLQGPTYATNALRIAEQREFIYWAGGKCTLPEGLLIEVVQRTGDKYRVNTSALDSIMEWNHNSDVHVIAYRILGVEPGYTDNPDEATPHGK